MSVLDDVVTNLPGVGLPSKRHTGRRSAEDRAASLLLKPPVKRVGMRTFASGFALIVPVYAAALIVAPTEQRRVSIVIAGIAYLAGAAVVAVRFARARIEITARGVIEHGILPPAKSTAMSAVASVLVVPVYEADGVRIRQHLFVTDDRGRTVLRMRGTFWSAKQIHTAARRIDAPSTTVDAPLTRFELRRDYYGLLYWYERHPQLAVLVRVIGGGAAAVLLVVSVRGGV